MTRYRKTNKQTKKNCSVATSGLRKDKHNPIFNKLQRFNRKTQQASSSYCTVTEEVTVQQHHSMLKGRQSYFGKLHVNGSWKG